MKTLSTLYADRKDGRHYIAILFQDEREVVTVPIKIHATENDESGVWPDGEFSKRFQPTNIPTQAKKP